MAVLPYAMFDLARSASDARRFDRVENIYHRGQDLAWDGRAVLAELVAKHGGPQIAPEKRAALSAVFGPIMWGELAAWKVSAQLADQLEPLEAKMAATSQAHDEARHFYVMHDYLELALGQAPKKMHPASERLLGCVLETDDLACKLLGMQLQVETTALTIFQAVREANVDPVLTELLPYFEKDEARHVGLGTQVLPMLMREMGRVEGAMLSAFALKVTFWLLASNMAMEPGLRGLGIEPRRMLTLAKSKQLIVFEELWQATEKTGTTFGDVVGRVMEATANAMWPPPGERGVVARGKALVRGLAHGVETVETSI
jgi:hypothetical protein